MKTLLILSSLLVLGACTPIAQEEIFPVLPEGLKDCKFYFVRNENSAVRVNRCPNSNTSYAHPSGRHTAYGATLEDPRISARLEAMKKLTPEEINLLGIQK